MLRILKEVDNRKRLELLHLLVHKDDSISWASLLHLTKGIGRSFFKYIYGRAKQDGRTFAGQLLGDYEHDFPDAPASARKVKTAMRPVLQWLEDTKIPEEQPDCGWGQWIIDQGCKDPLQDLSDDFHKLLLDLDGLAEEKQSLTRYLAQVEPLGKDLALKQSKGARLMTMGGPKGSRFELSLLPALKKNSFLDRTPTSAKSGVFSTSQ